ncbi:MAG: hypothetical protein P1U56_02585 [Saprospiraceae bacterium]|nr:hypothetical protein [Saprospiraceae bacterium]
MPIPQSTHTNSEINTTAQSQIHDLIGNPPGWLLRSGITMVAIVTSILLTGSCYFEYPDKLIGEGVLTSDAPPIELVSRSTGYIERIYAHEGCNVKKGEAVLFINNTTDQTQIIQLEHWIKKYNTIEDIKMMLQLDFVKGLQLGSLQNDYASLELRFNELQQTLRDDIVFQQINNINREIQKIGVLNGSHNKEMEIYGKELELSRVDYSRNKKLEIEGAISRAEFEKFHAVLLQKERQFEGMNNILIQNRIRIDQLEMEKLNLKQKRSKALQNYTFSISEIISRIKTSIENWNKTYIVEAPIDGKVTYLKGVSDQKNIKQGQAIGYIIPTDNQINYVTAEFPGVNIGKVEKGQDVIIKFDGYPYKEYGVLTSKVSVVSKIPEENRDGRLMYELKIPIPNTIITDYQDTIQYKPQMSVTAEVITENKTVFSRIFNQFLSILKKH